MTAVNPVFCTTLNALSGGTGIYASVKMARVMNRELWRNLSKVGLKATCRYKATLLEGNLQLSVWRLACNLNT